LSHYTPSETTKQLHIEIYLNISQIYLFQSLTEKAKAICKDAIKFCESNLASFHPLLKKCYAFLGNLDFLEGNYIAASSDFEMAININKKILHEDHESFIELYYDWATTCRKSGKFQDALRIYNQVLHLFENSKKIYKSQNQIEEQYISINSSIAKTNFDLNNFQNAVEYYEKVIELEFASKNKINLHRVYDEYYILAICYNNIQDFNSAIERCHKIIELSNKNMDFHHEKYIDAFILLGDIFSNLENFEEVVNYYEAAIKLITKNNDKYDAEKFFEVSGNLGLAYTNLKNFGEANKLLENTLEKYKSFFKKYENPTIFWLINGSGIVYETQKNYRKAIEIYEEGVFIAEK
jgi:tetratricopeptide (TPR) repeat protein